MEGIKRVYIGIPEDLRNLNLWGVRENRKNYLSHIPRGNDAVVEYHNKNVFGYDWIKFPSRYVNAIWDENKSKSHKDYRYFNENRQPTIIRQHISRIFAKSYEKSNYNTEPYKGIWNSKTSIKLP
jgi:hypothetical protein